VEGLWPFIIAIVAPPIGGVAGFLCCDGSLDAKSE
jgi:hypothetical protein